MDIAQIINFEGNIDSLVWKSPIEDFNTSSVLIVPETHVALLVVNGNACDLFPPGRHILETPNIPLVKRIINIPTNGNTSFPCKVFYINKVHQMDITWGIPGEITLDDPKYQIFLHIGMCGNMNFRINDEGARPFMLKLVGFRDNFDSEEMISKFRGIIKKYVKSYISKIMNVGHVSYFDMNENLFEVSEVVKEQLIPLFLDYGIDVLQFNIEAITVPDEDFEAVKKAKEARASRIIQGYSWQEEQQAEIAKTFAGNEGTIGNMAGAVGGAMMGGVMGGSIADIARNALSPDRIPSQNPPSDLRNEQPPMDNIHSKPFDVSGFMNSFTKDGSNSENDLRNNEDENVETFKKIEIKNKTSGEKFCINCGQPLAPGAKFCYECGTKVNINNTCPNCGYVFEKEMKFCPECGMKQ